MSSDKDTGNRAVGSPTGPVSRWRRRLTSRRFIVVDRSMTPTFVPGDRLLADVSWYRERPVQRGDVVVLHDPLSPERLLLKRVAGVAGASLGPIDPRASSEPERRVVLDGFRVPPGHVLVVSDNSSEGRDSRQFGPRPVGDIVAKVWYRSAPRSRRGPV